MEMIRRWIKREEEGKEDESHLVDRWMDASIHDRGII